VDFMNRDRSRRRGFTLIEILIVVIIAGLMAAIAVPGFTRAMKGAQLRSAARTLSMAHKFARNTAVLRQTPMALLVDTEARAIEVLSLHSRNSKFCAGRISGRPGGARGHSGGRGWPARPGGAAGKAPD
jgi:type II secretion system protein H